MATANIVYASMTGNTQEIAEIVEEALEDLGLETTLTEVTQADPEDFADADICVVASYTYSDSGDGQVPDEALDFYEDLADTDLTGKVFGVVGSGDHFYDDFCSAVDQFDAAFKEAGAVSGATNVKVDLAPEEADITALEAFAKELAAKLD